MTISVHRNCCDCWDRKKRDHGQESEQQHEAEQREPADVPERSQPFRDRLDLGRERPARLVARVADQEHHEHERRDEEVEVDDRLVAGVDVGEDDPFEHADRDAADDASSAAIACVR